MKIDAVDFFYLAMPEITTEADGSQDALLVRVSAGGHVGWGECEASPLVSIAAFVCPMSHGVCRPVGASVLGQAFEGPADIARMAALVEYDSMDLLQAAHTWSGVEMALWDLLGKVRGEPVWKLLGYRRAEKKTPYASQLFGDTPQETLDLGRAARAKGFAAVKFGWGPVGRGAVEIDRDHILAAREGLGPDGILLVDVGQIFGEDVEAAAARLPALEAAGAVWLEEPFHASALEAYGALARRSPKVKLAGGEGAHNVFMARQLIDYGQVGFVQIDCGRIGGIGPAKKIADYAVAKGVTYVNHTFTSHLALSASIQPFAGLAHHRICEYPVAPKQLAIDLTRNHITRDADGEILVPDAPGLGIDIDLAALRTYLVDVEIKVRGERLFATPDLV
ncbi:mandelate racemase/muconate lactonizing enzyme family protein [Labrys monachus]|uniref:L-alanine-DL-glutamate epimerase-like enolase superfamily enzyme n=1 Tax=Labrys monachus TaxID=217067 RepID=A0ABU0FM78_9HYPH|nr:mandelate racemase/muconate lactonizing enzyme family protein [Labrys monachus]MDQ0395704.1 L-alanine-DL-glutamate epimerase-like enolase superfamily enzyme [Labrys monachus]